MGWVGVYIGVVRFSDDVLGVDEVTTGWCASGICA